MKNKILYWWHHLSDRERIILSWGGAIVIVIATYSLLWKPLANKNQSLRQHIHATQLLQNTLIKNAEGISRLRQTAAASNYSSANTFLPIVEKSLEQRNLNADSLSAINSREIRAEYNSVPFGLLILWLYDLQLEYGIKITQATFTQTSEEGKVAAQINISL